MKDLDKEIKDLERILQKVRADINENSFYIREYEHEREKLHKYRNELIYELDDLKRLKKLNELNNEK